MEDTVLQLIAEAINLELNVSELYLAFQARYEEDSAFWWELALEEKNHAALLKSGKDIFLTLGEFPQELIAASLESLVEANREIVTILRNLEKENPTREQAFSIAIKIEESAGEMHYQNAMEHKTGSGIMQVFQKLNKDDKEHARRLREYKNSQTGGA